jgi:hypothetical protein
VWTSAGPLHAPPERAQRGEVRGVGCRLALREAAPRPGLLELPVNQPTGVFGRALPLTYSVAGPVGATAPSTMSP